MLSIISTVLLFASNVNGQITACGNKYYLNPKTSEGASFCSNEGGSCSGPGRVYYGNAATWTYKDLAAGESISCSTDAMGCDPLPLVIKQCYKVESYQYVKIDFSRIRLLKTNEDGGDTEEWDFVDSLPGVQMNVPFILTNDRVFFGCTYFPKDNDDFDIGGVGIKLVNNNGDDCTPPDNKQDSNGFYNCYFNHPPFAYVSTDTYESGLKYTFDFQVGDFNIADNNEFDNGPHFDFTYTEPDHKSITALRNAGGSIERYFTRTGPEGRQARLYAKYTLITLPDPIANIGTNDCN